MLSAACKRDNLSAVIVTEFSCDVDEKLSDCQQSLLMEGVRMRHGKPLQRQCGRIEFCLVR
ncbi:hypothetical protein l11_20570 [Neisseria weaveri LMG 5135]|nr:hypothetical protein l11_20570 [Neisseria weaveri LMG 5135]